MLKNVNFAQVIVKDNVSRRDQKRKSYNVTQVIGIKYDIFSKI